MHARKSVSILINWAKLPHRGSFEECVSGRRRRRYIAPMTQETVPEIFTYLAYRRFLNDWFAQKKSVNPRFSHRLFARRAQVRSPSLLKEVIAGRRNLTSTTIQGFAQAMNLREEEALFFTDLVHLDQAKGSEGKNTAWERVAASRRFRSARPIEGAMVRDLSTWYYPATRELAHRDDFCDDPQWVASQLIPKITPSQAQEALDTLHELGMLVEADGKTGPADVSLATPHEAGVNGMAVHNYHQAMLERAQFAMQTVPAEERHLCALTVAIPSEMVAKLKSELDSFQERLLNLCDEHARQSERVYQVNFQMFPLSRDPGGA